MRCETCKHSTPQIHKERKEIPTGFYFCELKKPYLLRSVCDIGRHEAKPVPVSLRGLSGG